MTDHPRAGLTLIERCETHQGAQVSACLQCEVEALRRERAELRAALRTYGRHHDTCGDMDGYNGVHPVRCDCGLDELREEG